MRTLLRITLLILQIAIVAQSSLAWAQYSGRGGSGGGRSSADLGRSNVFGQGILHHDQGLSTTDRTSLFNMLLGGMEGPQWPPYPRMWHEEYKSKYISTDTFYIPNFVIISGGKKIEYRYGRKMTLVLMTSLQTPNVDENNPEPQVINVEAHRMFELRNSIRYPRIRENIPTVGFCSYELSIAAGDALVGKVQGLGWLGLGQKIETEEIKGANHFVISKFFTVPKDASVEFLFTEYCENTFKKYVRPVVEANFIPYIVELTYLHSPKNECHKNALDNESGDFECKDWFNNRFDNFTKTIAVPRCINTTNGINLCQLRAKESKSCPIYEDQQGMRYDGYKGPGLKKITMGPRELMCDDGLTCEMTSEPKSWLKGLISLNGRAYCKK